MRTNVVSRLASRKVIGVANVHAAQVITVGLVSRAVLDIVTVASVSQVPSAVLVLSSIISF